MNDFQFINQSITTFKLLCATNVLTFILLIIFSNNPFPLLLQSHFSTYITTIIMVYCSPMRKQKVYGVI